MNFLIKKKSYSIILIIFICKSDMYFCLQANNQCNFYEIYESILIPFKQQLFLKKLNKP